VHYCANGYGMPTNTYNATREHLIQVCETT
jgi:hypothetical protein